MYIGIVLVQDDGVVSVHFCPAFDAGDDGGLACNFGYFLDSANKFGADKAFVNKFISRLKPAFGKPLCHSSGSSRAAWGAIDGLVSIKYCISSRATCVDCFSGPKDMRQSSNAFLLWVDKLVFFIHFLAQVARHRDELLCFEVFDTWKILLRIYDAIKIAPIGHIDGKLAQFLRLDFKAFCSQKAFDVGKLHRGDLLAYLGVFHQH